MKRNIAFILPLLSLLSISSHAMTEDSYRDLCMRSNLSYQKQLVCKKHKARLDFKQSSNTPQSMSYRTSKQVLAPTNTPEANPNSFKQQRIAKRNVIKPYIPGAYKKVDDGDNK